MTAVRLLLVVLVSALPLMGQGRRGAIWDILDALGESADRPPTLEEIFGEIGTLLEGVDPTRLKAIEARIAEADEEIRHLETLQSALDRGIHVQFPDVLRERVDVPASTEALLEEQRLLSETKARKVVLEGRRERPVSATDGSPPKGLRVSASGSVALDLTLEIPEPLPEEAITDRRGGIAVDGRAFGKALFLAGDFRGALDAYSSLPEDQRSLEAQYQMARCHEMLGDWAQAKQGYETVGKADPSGPWGDLARWMLDMGERKQGIRSMLDRSAGKKGK